MPQERGSFRRKLFGGFDRTDVINYIENIAGQRNKYQTEAQRFADESAELRTKLDSLTDQLKDKDTRLTEANGELDTARKELNDVWKELRETMDELETVKGQLERTSKDLTVIKGQLDNSNKELELVKAQLDRSNKELAAQSAQHEKDIAAAQKALEDAKADAETQRIAVINNASQITAELRAKYEDTKLGVAAASDSFKRELYAVSESMSAMSTAFTDAEAKIQQLIADKEN